MHAACGSSEGPVLVYRLGVLQRRAGVCSNVCVVSVSGRNNNSGGGGSDAVWSWVSDVWCTLLASTRVTAALSHIGIEATGDVAMLAHRPSSTRKRVWRVTPVSETDGCERARWGDDTSVVCGHLFNAEAERTALGLGVGPGEECCIALEPIADVVLPFCTDLRVVPMHPQFTGVELRCGHRFSAVSLLWHWCTATMICPICRAQYAPTVGGRLQEVQACSVGNFPPRSWQLLRRLVRAHWDGVRRDQEQESMQFIAENVVDDSMQTVMGSVDAYFLALSVQQADESTMVRFLPLQRTSSNEQVLEESVLRFMVPRASISRFSSAVSSFITNDAAVAPRGDDTNMSTSTRMQTSIMLRIAFGRDGESIMIPVAQIVDINLPVLTPRAAVQQAAPAPMAFDNGLEDAAAVLGVAYVNTTAGAHTSHVARSGVPLEPITFPEPADVAPMQPEFAHHTASSAPDPRQTLHPVATPSPPLCPSPQVGPHRSFDAVPNAAEPQRSSAIYAPCVGATGEMAMQFYRFAGVGTNTLLSMGLSVDLLGVLRTTSQYLSSDTRQALVDAALTNTPPIPEAAPSR